MFPKTMGTILKERLSAQTRDTETEYCTVAKLRNITPDVIPPDTLRNIERITKGLSVRLQGLMQSLFPSAPYPSTRGRLNTAKLFRIKTGNPKVFIQKTEAVAINTSLHILLDASASMYGKRMELATASCHAIASPCSGIRGLNITITAFNGNHRGDACSVYPLLKIRTTRSCPHQPHSPRRDASGPRALVDHETTSVQVWKCTDWGCWIEASATSYPTPAESSADWRNFLPCCLSCCMTFLQGRAGHVYRKTRLEVSKMRICGRA